MAPGSFEPPPKALNSVQTPACDLEKATQAFAGTLRQALQHAATSLELVIVLEMSPGPIIRQDSHIRGTRRSKLVHNMQSEECKNQKKKIVDAPLNT